MVGNIKILGENSEQDIKGIWWEKTKRPVEKEISKGSGQPCQTVQPSQEIQRQEHHGLSN